MAPSLPDERRTIRTTDTPEQFRNFGASTAEYLGDYPSGTVQFLDSNTDNKLTNPKNNGLGHVMDVALEFAREHGRVPDEQELYTAYLGREVEIDGKSVVAGDHLEQLAIEQVKQIRVVAYFLLGGFADKDDDEPVDMSRVGDFDMSFDIVWEYIRDKLIRKTAHAAYGEWEAVNVMHDVFADEGTRALRTNAELHSHDLGGEAEGIDAAIKKDGEWVTLQVKPEGEPDSKANADYLVTYDANTKVAGDMKIAAEPQ